MEEHKRISTSTSHLFATSTKNLTDFKSTNDDPEFGKNHEWKRLSLILVSHIFFILTLGFSSLESFFWAPNNGILIYL